MNNNIIEGYKRQTEKVINKITDEIKALFKLFNDGTITKWRFKREWAKIGKHILFTTIALQRMLKKEKGK